METLGEFVSVVMRVQLRAQVDVALRLLERAEIAPDIFRIRRALDHRRDHEGGVDDLAESKLLGEIIWPVEQRGRRALAVEQHLDPVEQHAVLEGQLYLVRRKILLQ